MHFETEKEGFLLIGNMILDAIFMDAIFWLIGCNILANGI
jgi:hypothetical protein